jgi:Flp pilus assembly protein TadG
MISKISSVGKMARMHRRESGQSIVEVALTVPLLCLLLAGGAEFARMAYAAIEVTNAAKAAVQYAAQQQSYTIDTTGMQNAINNEVTNVPGLAGASLQSATTTASCSDGTVPTDGTTGGPYSSSDCSGSTLMETLAVTTTSTFTPGTVINPFLKACSLPTSFTLTGYATQVVLQ